MFYWRGCRRIGDVERDKVIWFCFIFGSEENKNECFESWKVSYKWFKWCLEKFLVEDGRFNGGCEDGKEVYEKCL